MAGAKRGWVVRRLLALPAVGFTRLTGIIPLGMARRLGRWAGRAAYYLVPRIRRVGMANLDLAYGDTLTRDEKRAILLGAAENVGIVAAEFSRIPRVKDYVASGRIRLVGMERIDRERGVLLTGAHLGNWEWMAPAMQAFGISTAEIVRPLDDSLMNRVVDGTRRSGGIATIPKEGAGGEMLRLLRERWIVGVLADQSSRASAVPVTFFGKPCWGTVAPVMAALRAKVPVHAVSMHRDSDGWYTMEILPALEFTRTGDLQDDLVHNSQLVQDALEAIVRAHPEQWLWLHRRWKPRPALEAEWAAKKGQKALRQNSGDGVQ